MHAYGQLHGARHHEEQDIYRKLVGMRPELMATALLVERARERIAYPIASYEDLARLADPGRASCDLDGVRIGLREAKRFFPRNFFPIEDEDALIGRLIAAFVWGNAAHDFEAKMKAAAREIG